MALIPDQPVLSEAPFFRDAADPDGHRVRGSLGSGKRHPYIPRRFG